MKKIKLFICVISVWECTCNGLLSQNALNMTLNCDSISTTIFNQDGIAIHIDYSDSSIIQYYQRVSGIEIDFGNGIWNLYKDRLTDSDGDLSFIRHEIVEFINLPGVFCQDTLLLNSLKNAGGEIRLRFRIYCSIDSMPFNYHYSGIKKMKLPAATSDDINALRLLKEHGIDCDFFSWLHEFPEETETIFTYIADNYPNSVIADIAKYHAMKLELSRDYYEDDTYSEEVINKAKNTFNSLLYSKSKYLRIFAKVNLGH